VSHRRQQKEALRKEREERERREREAQQRKRMVGYGAAALLVAVVAVVLAVFAMGSDDGGGGDAGSAGDVFPSGGSVPEQKEFEVRPAAAAANCELKSNRATSREHTTSLEERIKYSTNPPDSGRHYIEPAGDGAYGEAPEDSELVHGLEHGRVIVWVKPNLPEEERANLKALFDEDTYQMFLVPRADMPYAVAASAWNAEPAPNGTGRLLLCKEFTPEVYDALRAFRDEHRSRGPEPVP
jgi:Protein of unknown function (DUF3105)